MVMDVILLDVSASLAGGAVAVGDLAAVDLGEVAVHADPEDVIAS